MFLSSINEIIRLFRTVEYLLQNYYWEKMAFSKLRFPKFSLQVSFWGAINQSTMILSNFKNFCCNLKIGGVGAKARAAFRLF